ncbi:MAG: aminotransferase [Marinibacterium sp.]
MKTGRTAAAFAPPVMAASRWLEGVTFPPHNPLINVCQAAPVDPPPPELRTVMAEAALAGDAHFYGPDLGHPPLRAALAATTSGLYGGAVSGDQVAITSGCNQAFAAAILSLAGEGDEVLLPVPWYFNHKMWLDMTGIAAHPVPTDSRLLPHPDTVAGMITPRTRALALVSPNNPAGVEYPANLLRAMYDLCRRHGILLILDETYRDFRAGTGAPHDLFTDPGWPETLIHLYSFSKAYRLTGHRVGALIARPDILAEAEKFIDAVTICPNQIAQIAALWGLENLDPWLAGQRAEILSRRRAIETGFPALADRGWTLAGLGGFFAYLRHPFAVTSADLAPRLVRDAGVLLLPGDMFRPQGDPAGAREVRVAFANLDRDGITQMFDRLARFAL